MAVLTPQQRNTLESAVKNARSAAEQGAFNALHSLGIDNTEPFGHLSPEQRTLRNRLRSKGRLLGDELPASGEQNMSHLCYELAYETWHKMLFAKFLEANDLLMHPDGVAVTLDDCEELARDENFVDKWEAAANYASLMLPAIFRPDDPLMQIHFATNDRIRLESIIDALETSIFTADDALGWVYQFWQSEAKAMINASGEKIDGAKLPAVTQLFTEPYMVNFLIDNTIGAWWVSRNPGITPPVKFEYLRLVETASSRLNSKLRQDAEATDSYFSYYEEVENLNGNLPHWRQEGKIYFVTFRTADSMPQELLREWEEELDVWKKNNPEPHSYEQRKDYHKRFTAKMEYYLDCGYGECLLAKPELKMIVENALRFFDGKRYNLDEFIVMPNHVHLLVQPLGENQLSDILHSWKSFTANEINKKTGKTGAFWQKESYDHIVRNESALKRIREYIKNNVKTASTVKTASSRSNIEVQTASSCLNLRQDAGVTLDAGATLPAAGNFEGWPSKTSDITSLDPCMGSGHFIASLFTVFATLRMYEEGLSKEEATDRVITENLYGLELDARCTQIAAFNLALTAWKFCGYYRALPEMNLACSGIAPKGKVEDWIKLVETANDERLENGMRMLYDHFQLAPELGSLLDPSTIKADAFTAGFNELQPYLAQALAREVDKDQIERGVMAAGIAKAGEILAQKYTLQITNVPYLSKRKQDTIMADYCEKMYSDSKADLATVFYEKMINSCIIGGTACCVMPQNWLAITTYNNLRKKLIEQKSWSFISRLGTKSFSTPMFDFNVVLISISNKKSAIDNQFFGLDVSSFLSPTEKSKNLVVEDLVSISQKAQLQNPDCRLVLNEDYESNDLKQLSFYATCNVGLLVGDWMAFRRNFWEISRINSEWRTLTNTVSNSVFYDGCDDILFWPNNGEIYDNNPNAYIKGKKIWNKKGVSISMMAKLPACLYMGGSFRNGISVIVPKKEENLLAIWAYTSSPEYNNEVRKIDQKLYVTTNTLIKVPFDLAHWQTVAEEKYPNGLPKPYSDDATQWLFHGHPIKSDNPLQVAIARLLGYRWPAENDAEMELADEARELIAAVKAFDDLSDDDGIFCIPSVNGEEAGADRVRGFLQAVYGEQWSNSSLSALFTKEGASSSNLEDWLRKEFFVQHCKLFQNRPFIWHIWDGRADGFSALVNYHTLTKENFSKLIYTYLGDWIRMCEAKKNNEESGAEGLLSAALKLKEKLELILEGEAPYDIFVRWKPIVQQPIGWEPDLNDGVRLNVRPFVEAGVLRSKFNVKWGIDRGKNPAGAHWGEIRDNDRHLTLEEKRKAREEK